LSNDREEKRAKRLSSLFEINISKQNREIKMDIIDKIKRVLSNLSNKFPSSLTLIEGIEKFGLFEGELWIDDDGNPRLNRQNLDWSQMPYLRGNWDDLRFGCVIRDGNWLCIIGNETHSVGLRFDDNGVLLEIKPDSCPSLTFWKSPMIDDRRYEILDLAFSR